MYKFSDVYDDIGLPPDDAVIARALMVALMYTTLDERVLPREYVIEAMAEIEAWEELLDRKFGDVRDKLKLEWHRREYILNGDAAETEASL